MVSVEDGSLPGGKVGKVGKNFTVNLSRELLQATGWAWQSGPQLMTQLLEEGRIRLRLASELQPKVEALRAAFQRSNGPARDEGLATLADRYREVAFYTASNQRVRLDPTIAAYLGIFVKGDRTVFIEARRGAIDMMSLTYRNQRQADYAEETDL
jgi:hypothetical protein